MPPSFREREDAVCMSPIDKVVPCDRRSSPRPRPCLADAAVCCASAPRIFLDPPFPCRHDRHPITLFHVSRRVSRPLPRLPVFCLRVLGNYGWERRGRESPRSGQCMGSTLSTSRLFNLCDPRARNLETDRAWRIGRQLSEKVRLVKNFEWN